MPVRFRITIIYSVLVFIILALVCFGIYFSSYKARIDSIQTRLTNRAISTARLLSQREIFDRNLIQRIDSSTTISLQAKAAQAYDQGNRRIYSYSDIPNDTLPVSADLLSETREKEKVFFIKNNKEAVAYHFVDGNTSIVVMVAGIDTDGHSNLDNLVQILIISFLVGNIFVLISGYFFSRGLLLPIKRITEDVAEISAQNLTRRIKTGDTKDEWGQLAATLNDLLNRLQDSFDMQRSFIANASHELSTPLTAISSQLEVTLHKERNAAEYKKVMESIYQDVRHMNKLTQTLLEFAKASGNAGGLDIKMIRIDEILLQLPAEILKVNAAFSVKLDFVELPEDENALLVFGNEDLLLSAIRNIVINACKYSEDQRASVILSFAGNQNVISVRDNGPGIPQEEIEKIFQPFYRIIDVQNKGGFGLGLPLAHRIIKIHKGTIEVDTGSGKGTKFIIRLPSAKHL